MATSELAVKGARHRWKPAEDEFIRAQVGIIPFSKLGEKFNTNPRAVQRRANKLGVYFFDAVSNQGQVSAAEAGRILGFSTTAVIDRLQAGSLEGKQIGGHFWKVDLKTVDRDSVLTSRESDGHHCLNCSDKLSKGRMEYCGQRCKSEFVPGMIFPPEYRLSFQKWLAENGLMGWRPVRTGSSGKLELQDGLELTDQEAQIERILLKEFPRRLVPWQYLAKRVEGLERGVSSVNQAIDDIKEKLSFKGGIVDSDGLAWGLGIDPAVLSSQQLRLLRRLWQFEDVAIPRFYLVRNTFQGLQGSQLRQHNVVIAEQVSLLNTKLEASSSGYRVLTERAKAFMTPDDKMITRESYRLIKPMNKAN